MSSSPDGTTHFINSKNFSKNISRLEQEGTELINKLDNLLSQNERGSMAHITEYEDNPMNKKSDLNMKIEANNS